MIKTCRFGKHLPFGYASIEAVLWSVRKERVGDSIAVRHEITHLVKVINRPPDRDVRIVKQVRDIAWRVDARVLAKKPLNP